MIQLVNPPIRTLRLARKTALLIVNGCLQPGLCPRTSFAHVNLVDSRRKARHLDSRCGGCPASFFVSHTVSILHLKCLCAIVLDSEKCQNLRCFLVPFWCVMLEGFQGDFIMFWAPRNGVLQGSEISQFGVSF